jgi:hypothetical protein
VIDLTPAWLTLPGVGLAFLVLAAWLGLPRLPHHAARTLARPALVLLLATLAAIYAAGKDRAQIAAAREQFARLSSSRDPANSYRDTFLSILAYERETGASCPRRRLFITTRFDAPLDLQPPRFENELLESRVTFELSRMRMLQVGSGPCDYVIASRGEIDSVRGVPLLNLLKPTGNLRAVGQAGEFVVFAARRPGAPVARYIGDREERSRPAEPGSSAAVPAPPLPRSRFAASYLAPRFSYHLRLDPPVQTRSSRPSPFRSAAAHAAAGIFGSRSARVQRLPSASAAE